ncbi:hypothetical protein FRB90_009153 [Tulasnella sp. 427]|nr:hypothetical protein FRB90_009153 [Tulasnella sp. 427]
MASSTTTFDFALYLTNILSIPASDVHVQVLSGGFTNLTARVLFSSPPTFPTRFNFPTAPHTVILKQATPYMHSFPSQTVPMKRQAIEARALRILQGIDRSVTGVAEALVRVPNLKIPRLVFHDTEHNVLWMTDIGDGKTLTDYILSKDLSLSKIEDLAESLGTFIIGLYSATQNPGSEITSTLADSQHLMEFLTLDSARIVQEVSSDWQKDPADTQLLLDRLRDVLSPDTNQDRCLGMVDFWPGNTPVLLTGELGLIDWEHFGLSDPGCELGLYGAPSNYPLASSWS